MFRLRQRLRRTTDADRGSRPRSQHWIVGPLRDPILVELIRSACHRGQKVFTSS